MSDGISDGYKYMQAGELPAGRVPLKQNGSNINKVFKLNEELFKSRACHNGKHLNHCNNGSCRCECHKSGH